MVRQRNISLEGHKRNFRFISSEDSTELTCFGTWKNGSIYLEIGLVSFRFIVVKTGYVDLLYKELIEKEDCLFDSLTSFWAGSSTNTLECPRGRCEYLYPMENISDYYFVFSDNTYYMLYNYKIDKVTEPPNAFPFRVIGKDKYINLIEYYYLANIRGNKDFSYAEPFWYNNR